MSSQPYTIRKCSSFADYQQCMALQRKVWQAPDLEITPARIFIISQNGGGFLIGAFTPQDEMLGFLHCFPAFDEQTQPIYYSHMLAVEPALQNSGIGRDLKLWQYEYARQNQIAKVIWTFDPLQSRNAHFNINRLGCVVRTYKVNFYGTGNNSVFDAGIEADRVVAEWWVREPRVAAIIGGQPNTIPANAPYVEIPADFAPIRNSDLAAAKEWRYRVRTEFEQMLAQGLTCVAFERLLDQPFSRYYFTHLTA